jgi:hypothetical protein
MSQPDKRMRWRPTEVLQKRNAFKEIALLEKGLVQGCYTTSFEIATRVSKVRWYVLLTIRSPPQSYLLPSLMLSSLWPVNQKLSVWFAPPLDSAMMWKTSWS